MVLMGYSIFQGHYHFLGYKISLVRLCPFFCFTYLLLVNLHLFALGLPRGYDIYAVKLEIILFSD